MGAAALLAGSCASTDRPPAVALESASGSGPVAAVDPRYTPDGLRDAFARLCRALHYRPLRVEVDQSEYPFVVYGVLEGRCDYQHIRNALFRMPGYAYAGSVTSVQRDGSWTIFALNMTPPDSIRVDQQRLLARLKALADTQR